MFLSSIDSSAGRMSFVLQFIIVIWRPLSLDKHRRHTMIELRNVRRPPVPNHPSTHWHQPVRRDTVIPRLEWNNVNCEPNFTRLAMHNRYVKRTPPPLPPILHQLVDSLWVINAESTKGEKDLGFICLAKHADENPGDASPGPNEDRQWWRGEWIDL